MLMYMDVFLPLLALPILGAALYGVVELGLQRWPVPVGLVAGAGSFYGLSGFSMGLAATVALLLLMRAGWLGFHANRQATVPEQAQEARPVPERPPKPRRVRRRRTRAIHRAQLMQAAQVGAGSTPDR